MKFSEIEYKRPNVSVISEKFEHLVDLFQKAESFDEQDALIRNINDLRMEFQTLGTIASIKYSIDTNDKEFEEEQNFYDENSPIFDGLVHKYYTAIVNSKYRAELEKKWGKQLFDVAEVTLRTFSPEIIEDLKKENELRTDYSKLLASAKIFFDGEEKNLQGLIPYMESTDREMRKAANEAKWKFFAENEAEFDRLYDELVKIRAKMAKKLGYKNFVQMGYDRMGRTDYNAEMVKNFRDQVLETIVPIAVKLKQKQQKRLGLESFKYYDQPLDYKSGNAKPHGSPDWIVSCAKNMYSELSPETNEFFNFMLDNEMMDLVNKKGKDTGGYCTFIEKYKSPFIFSNFNGTMGDIEVLTHEAGHAFQAYSSRNFEIPEYFFPTSEACEIHSMSMEFLTWPWMNCFFKDQTDKFKYSHLKGSVIFIPYGVSVDEFQHWVYDNPEAAPAERKQAWLDIEKKYLPYIEYDNNEFLEKGGRWQQQRHIYMSPFYYIDYCLAQICAFQFWKRSNENREQALEDYLRLCKAGGSQSFLGLVNTANLISPFEDGCLKSFMGVIDSWLEGFDDASVN
ncbi:MAG TPA: M3 family oligoendopeptidase [Ignavibacteria bacterium]|nr:M3 family oligoendopeptidase [Ignavibacteria bacterium]HRF64821.1 M3 family oligoendopeptidase [Ignavibacteria bacterium]HRJ04583.1 M3 family oligoendopeptidase [Ignavibacteria bacterium]HRJ85892.1 M3 family oligoendopeptidase [Ignavibacteria bacterium]